MRECFANYVAPYNGVFVPKGGWSRFEPTPREPDCSSDIGRTINYFSLPRGILHDFQGSLASLFEGLHVKDFFQRIPRDDLEGLATAVVPHVESVLAMPVRVKEPKLAIHFHHLRDDAPRMGHVSTTYSESGVDGWRGLHIDNWERPFPALSKRSRAGVKLLMNVGTEARSFIYVPQRADRLFELAISDPDGPPCVKEGDLATRLSEWYLDQNPEADVYRVVIEPGDAIIAPVQNLIHDGYPRGMKGIDFCFQLRIFPSAYDSVHAE